MTAIPTTATVTAAAATCELPRKTFKHQRAMTSPGWVFAITALVSPLAGLTIYGLKQKSWAYFYVGAALFVGIFAAADVEGEIETAVGHLPSTGLQAAETCLDSDQRRC